MDLKSFAEEDFDPKQWINKAWSSSGNQEKEVFVANSVSRLQLYMKQLTNSLDETTTQIVTSIPRVLQDASALQVEGALLQQKLLSLEQKVQDVEEETGHSIESLQRIDQLKTRLENAASTLREADKWAALASALEDTLETGVPTQKEQLAELTERVAAMTASLEVLSDAPDYEDKSIQLETLYNRLEAAVSSPLIDALTKMDADRSVSYVALFTAMGRLSSLTRCWRRSAASSAVTAWSRLDAPSLSQLRATLASNVHTQVEWLSDVLKSETPLTELVRLHTDLLMSLEPSPTKVLSANLKLCSSPQEGIVFLTDVRSELDQFAATFSTLLESRQSRESVPPAAVSELARCVYAPLRELLPQYSDLQTHLYLAYLDNKDLEQEDLLERSRAFQALVERSEGWLNSGLATGRKIAGAAIYPYFVPAVEVIFQALVERSEVWLNSGLASGRKISVFMPAVEAFSSMLCSKISQHTRRIETAFLSSTNNSGVLSTTFPAALSLSSAVGTFLDILAAVSNSIAEFINNEEAPNSPLLDIRRNLLDESVQQVSSPPSLASVPPLRRSGNTLRTLAGTVLREPVHRQLEKIPSLPVWSNNDAITTDLPDYALSPQEYITEVGQYLMTLPQHLEMHLSEKQAPWQFLTEVCTHTCEMYAQRILNVRNMDALGTRRCLTDIAYLSSVVEDLGGTITPSLRNLERSLRVAAQEDN